MNAAEDKSVKQIQAILEQQVPNKTTKDDLKEDFKNESVLNKNDSSNLIKNVNNKVLLDILSPEIKENEQAKRKHKYILIVLLAIFLIVQFIAVYCISNNIINYAVSADANIDIVNSLLTFATGYITSVIIELIAILNYIVKNVFDTSLIELVKIFRDKEKEET